MTETANAGGATPCDPEARVESATPVCERNWSSNNSNGGPPAEAPTEEPMEEPVEVIESQLTKQDTTESPPDEKQVSFADVLRVTLTVRHIIAFGFNLCNLLSKELCRLSESADVSYTTSGFPRIASRGKPLVHPTRRGKPLVHNTPYQMNAYGASLGLVYMQGYSKEI